MADYQHVIFRDLLKVLVDKCNTIRNYFQDAYSVKKVIEVSSGSQKREINTKMEQIIGLMQEIALMILQEFRESTEKIGINDPPDISNLIFAKEDKEEEVLNENMKLFNGMLDFLRDSVDCYFVMCRQKDRKPLEDHTCFELFQYISRGRFSAGDLMEELRILEKSADPRVIVSIVSAFKYIFFLQTTQTPKVQQISLDPKDYPSRAEYEFESKESLFSEL